MTNTNNTLGNPMDSGIMYKIFENYVQTLFRIMCAAFCI